MNVDSRNPRVSAIGPIATMHRLLCRALLALALAAALSGACRFAAAADVIQGGFANYHDIPIPWWSADPNQRYNFNSCAELGTAYGLLTGGVPAYGEEGLLSSGWVHCFVFAAPGVGLGAYYPRKEYCQWGWEDFTRFTRRYDASVPILCRITQGQKNYSGTFGPPCPDCGTNPVNLSTGNKYQLETDYTGAGVMPLRIERHYNSLLKREYPTNSPSSKGAFGLWRGYYDRTIRWAGQPSGYDTIHVERHDGRSFAYMRNTSGGWSPTVPYAQALLTELKDEAGVRTGWLYRSDQTLDTEEYDAEGRLIRLGTNRNLEQTLVYNAAGQLTSVSDAFGRSLQFSYDTKGRVVSIVDPANGTYGYTYSAADNLIGVTHPDGTLRTYVYDDPSLPFPLTGIVDENGDRYATWAYSHTGTLTPTPILSEHAGGANRVTLSYPTYTAATFTDAFGQQRQVQFAISTGRSNATAFVGSACPACGPLAATYDSNEFPASRRDWNGNRVNYTHDARGLETQRVEGLTAAGAVTPQTRTVNTEWHPNFRLSKRVAEPLRLTTWVYNGDGGAQCGFKADGVTLVPGVLCSKTVQATTDANGSLGFGATATGAPRVWTYTYNAQGQLLTTNGPRTDVADITTYTYYPLTDPDTGKRGNVATITNAAGHVTEITGYNAHGQPTTIVDANGLTTTLAYDVRTRLTSRTVGGETTAYEYDGVGQLIKVTLPDASFLAYTYDAAHRLTAMQDSLGNRITYTLDAMGNRTAEQVFDPTNALAQTRSRVYSNLNRLFREVGALGQTTEYTYDTQGNVTAVKDPLNRTTANQYDALNRLKQVTDPNAGVTAYGYNGLDALTSVSDPRNLVTGYTVDGLGNLTQQSSPDTGVTASTYDTAGNLATQTDAKGQTTSYAYDALNRVTLITFHDGSKQAYAYDAGPNGLGRLTGITETNPANAPTNQIAYGYDAHGRVISETRTLGGQSYVTAYAYDAAGRMSAMTYPSGRSVAYSFDALGRISAISTTEGAQTQVLVQSVAYHPFGGVKGYTLGNGQVYARSIDTDGRIAAYTLGAAGYSLAFDAASRITGITETANPSNANTYGYDALDRLTSAVLPAASYGYSYDAVGNRLSKTTGANTDTYAYAGTSNRIASITPASGPVKSFVFDANGSTTADGANSYAYDARGRMVQAVSPAGATGYQVNALGQRVRKTNPGGDTVFHYDTRGRLIAETDPGGALKREVLYLGDIPVGVVQ